MYVIECYASYLVISLAVTIWVAHTLHKNGRVFLVDAFHGNEALADSVNHLLVVGFYLISFGFIIMPLNVSGNLDGWRQLIQIVSDRMGGELMAFGAAYFVSLFVFSRLRKRAQMDVHPNRPTAEGTAR